MSAYDYIQKRIKEYSESQEFLKQIYLQKRILRLCNEGLSYIDKEVDQELNYVFEQIKLTILNIKQIPHVLKDKENHINSITVEKNPIENSYLRIFDDPEDDKSN